MSGERTPHSLQENEAIFSKRYIFPNFRLNFRNVGFAYYFCFIGGRITKGLGWHPLQESKVIFSKILGGIFEKLCVCLLLSYTQ